MADKFRALSAVVGVAGTSYLSGDILTVAGGSETVTAQFIVTSINTGSGAVLAVQLLAEGSYSAQPTNPASTTGGAGSGCTLTVTWVSQRLDSEESDVLQAVVNQLIRQIPALSPKTCFLAINPDPPFKIPNNQYLTVAPLAGNYPEDLLEGGAQHQATEESGVQVTIFSRFHAFRPGQEIDALVEWTRGVLRMKKLVLKALVGQDLTANGALMLRSLVLPKQSSFPEFLKDDPNTIKVAVSFSTSWDWNLTG